jgi:hypothetical protein
MATTDSRVEHESRPMPAEFQYLLVVAALFALLLLAGVPGRPDAEVGDGALAPDRAWVSTWATRASTLQADVPQSLPIEAGAPIAEDAPIAPAALPEVTEPGR